MTKKRFMVLLACGILAGLFLSACAGVAAGQVQDLAMRGEAPAGGFLFEVQAIPMPFFGGARPAHSAAFVFEKAAVQSPTESQSLAQYYMLCNKAGH